MKTNEELQKDVQNAIKWEPLLHDAEIGVSACGRSIFFAHIIFPLNKK